MSSPFSPYRWVSTHTLNQESMTGRVWLGSQDIMEDHWLHKPILQGEIFQVYTTEGTKRVGQ